MIKMVADKHIYHVIAQWGLRLESAEALATRWLALIERLKTIDPALARWTHWEDDRGFVPFDPRLEAQVARVIGGTTRTRDGRLHPRAGTYIWNPTDPCLPAQYFKVEIGAGRDYTSNYASGGTDYCAVPDPDLVTYDVLRGVMLAAAETFDARQARVYPTDLRAFWDDPRGIGDELDLAWISYVAPRFAPLVTRPRSVVVEHRSDGGLLMAATTDSFLVRQSGPSRRSPRDQGSAGTVQRAAAMDARVGEMIVGRALPLT